MNQIQVIVTAICSAAVFTFGAWVNGYRWAEKYTSLELAHANTDKAVRDVADAARKSTAEEISKIKITNTTINRKVEREVQEHTVYATCRVPASGMLIANEALAGRLSNSGQLPGALGTAGQ